MYKSWQEDKQFLLHDVFPFVSVMLAGYVFLILFIAVFGD